MIAKIAEEIHGLLQDGYPYSALGIALTLPDICGNIAYPGTPVGERYKKWYREYVIPISALKFKDGLDEEICYKLRCAYLHSGSFDFSGTKTLKDIDKFAVHYNRNSELRFVQAVQTSDGKSQFDIDLGVFCWQLCTAATEFYKSHQCECGEATITIEDTTPSETEYNELRKLIEENCGYTFEELREMKRRNPEFEQNFDFLK